MTGTELAERLTEIITYNRVDPDNDLIADSVHVDKTTYNKLRRREQLLDLLFDIVSDYPDYTHEPINSIRTVLDFYCADYSEE